MTIIHLIAQSEVANFTPILAQFGWPGLILLIIIKWLDRMERVVERGFENQAHVNRGLSKALWTDLAARPYSDAMIKAEAIRELAKIQVEAEEKAAIKKK